MHENLFKQNSFKHTGVYVQAEVLEHFIYRQKQGTSLFLHVLPSKVNKTQYFGKLG